MSLADNRRRLNTYKLDFDVVIKNLTDSGNPKFHNVIQLLHLCKALINVNSITKKSDLKKVSEKLKLLDWELDYFSELVENEEWFNYVGIHQRSIKEICSFFSLQSTTSDSQLQWSAIHRLACLLEQHL
jgi:hypothetical protein